MSLGRKRIRVAVDTASFDQFKDVKTGATPKLWRGNHVQFELGLFYGSALLESPADIESLTLEVKPLASRTSTPLMTKTIAAADIDTTVTDGTWEDESKQHAIIPFTDAETNLDLSGETSVDYWLVVSVITTTGYDLTLGWSHLTIEEDGAGAAGSPPVNDPLYYTKGQADARYVMRQENLANWKFEDGVLKLWNPTQSKYQPVGIEGTAGLEHFVILEDPS